MSLFRNIARSGLSDGSEYQLRRGILLSNYIALTLCGALLVLLIVRRIYFGEIPGGLNIFSFAIGMAIFGSPILINRAGQTTISRLLLCYAPVFFLWYVAITTVLNYPVVEQAGYDSVRIFLLALSFIPYLLLDVKKPFLLILGILPTLLSLLFFDFILTQFGLGINERGIPGIESQIIGSRTFIAYCILSLSCFIFQSIISYNDELNKTILSELKLKSEKIKSQHEELVQSHDQLNEINSHLEELVSKKTESIKQQNEQILKYAYANAHHVRGPIARLLGLIQLSKLETDPDYPWYFEKIENETHDVDKIVTGIARELDEIGQAMIVDNSQPNYPKLPSV